jgi:hypothetical protein
VRVGGLTAQSPKRKRLDGHRLSEFIYGTVTGMVAIVGIDSGGDVGWLEAALIVVTGATAIWIAHSYASLLSRRITAGRSGGLRDMAEALSGSWPIVTAGLFLAAPLFGVGLGIYGVGSALLASSALGVLILAMLGFVAGGVAQEGWRRRLLHVVFSCGLGVAVILVELAVHH